MTTMKDDKEMMKGLYVSSVKLAYNLLKDPVSAYLFTTEEISVSALFVSMRLTENHSFNQGSQLNSNG